MSKYSDNDIRLLDAMRESSFAYWNALLTLNGILITVFSAIAFIGKANKWIILALVVSSIVSASLLISNFLTTKEMYKGIGQLDLSKFDKMTEDEKKADLERSSSQRDVIERNELIVQGLMFVQAFIIILLFFV